MKEKKIDVTGFILFLIENKEDRKLFNIESKTNI